MGRFSFALVCLAACFTTQPSEALFSKKEAAQSCARSSSNPLTPLPLRLRRLSRKGPAPPFANLKLDCDVECSHCALQARGGFMMTNTEAATEATARVVEESFVNWMPLNAWKALMQVRPWGWCGAPGVCAGCGPGRRAGGFGTRRACASAFPS